MTKPSLHTRLLDFPDAANFIGGYLDGLRESHSGRQRELVLDYQALVLSSPPVVTQQNGELVEQIVGQFMPRRIRFGGVETLEKPEAYSHLDDFPPDHPVRSLRGVLHYRPIGQILPFTLIWNGSPNETDLTLSARDCWPEVRDGSPESVVLTRNWSPAPPLPAGLAPHPAGLYRLFGGDPISFRLGARVYHHRLFVGGVETQGDVRPSVDAVLNVSEDASRWVKDGQIHPNDRWVCKGEGHQGMDAVELAAEAEWVISRLRAGQRVLVHCSAGFNRSVTVCCAVLILLEGLTAEAALARVYQHHPWAHPDSRHWLTLRWMAQSLSTRICR